MFCFHASLARGALPKFSAGEAAGSRTRYAENVPARRLFPFLPLVCVSTPAALKANIHPRRHPFRCAQFSARWFSRGQGIHLRPYSRIAKIFTSSVRKAAAENQIVFGSRQLNHMPGRIGRGSSGRGSGMARADRRPSDERKGFHGPESGHKKTCPPGRIIHNHIPALAQPTPLGGHETTPRVYVWRGMLRNIGSVHPS